jgi:hypothetical protein
MSNNREQKNNMVEILIEILYKELKSDINKP